MSMRAEHLSEYLIRDVRERTSRYLLDHGIVLRKTEIRDIEVVDFGLFDLFRTGPQLVVYVNTPRYCAKDLILFPGRTCAEHRHPPVGDNPGKMETFRCRAGIVYLFVEGPPPAEPLGQVPGSDETHYTVFHEIVLKPGQQYTIPPDTLHWFQAGPDGALVSEFSSTSKDEFDVFTDPRIRRT
jgi:D-lyxose ketol-isomerase